jgi:acyl-CoA thioester hydrolase
MSLSESTPLPDFAEVRTRVRYAETDQMGVVYHANYLVWMEMARTELCRVRGFRYRDIEREDMLRMAVAEVNCRYRFPARYDDDIVAKAWVAHAHPRMVTFGYEIRGELSGEIFATGETRHVMIDFDGRPVKIPRKYFALFGLA